MNRSKRNLIFSLILLVALAAGLLFKESASVQAQTPTTQPRTVSVIGIGQVNSQPDNAVIVLGVQTQAETASQALTRNSAQMQVLIRSLRQGGVQSADVQTQTIQLQPQYQQPASSSGDQTGQLIGYIATNTVEVRVRDLDKLGSLLDAAVQAGGNTIQNIRFEVSDPAKQLDQAREAAMKDAKDKAEKLAALANAKLGPVYTISEYSQTPLPFFSPSVAAAEQAAVPVQPGTQTVEVEVNVSWYLE